jgi:transcription elongation factor Elf1
MTSTLTRSQLTTSDRCDRCGAAARVRAVLPSGGELLFCGHHGREHESKLKELSANIQAGQI